LWRRTCLSCSLLKRGPLVARDIRCREQRTILEIILKDNPATWYASPRLARRIHSRSASVSAESRLKCKETMSSAPRPFDSKAQFWILSRLIAQYSEAQLDCPVTYCYSRRGGRLLLEDRGFRLTGLFVDHIFCYSIPEYVQYRHKIVWYFRWLPRRVFRVRERLSGGISA